MEIINKKNKMLLLLLVIGFPFVSLAAPSSPSPGNSLYEDSSCIAVLQCSRMTMSANAEFGGVLNVFIAKSKSFKGEKLPSQIAIVDMPLPYKPGTKIVFDPKVILLVHLVKIKDGYYKFTSNDPIQSGGIEFNGEALLDVKDYSEFLVTAFKTTSDATAREHLTLMMGGLKSEIIRNHVIKIIKEGTPEGKAQVFNSMLFAGDREFVDEVNRFLRDFRGEIPEDRRETLERLLESK